MLVGLRSSLYFLVLTVTTVVFAVPLSIFGWFLPFSVLGRAGRLWGSINLEALRLICGLRYRVHGRTGLPDEPCIVLCKHQSAWETIALRALLPPNHTWVVKRELLWTPFFGWAMAVYRPIAIDRSAGRKAVRQLLQEGRRWLETGRWVVIFPEGTRVAPGERRKYGIGGALLAEKSGCPVLPVAHNAGVFWRRRDLRKYPGVVDLVFGDPFPSKGLSAAEINRRAEAWIETCVAELPQTRRSATGDHLRQGQE
jgi:1-acyl-sn-glycerol-3-phosphate acyltransferase